MGLRVLATLCKSRTYARVNGGTALWPLGHVRETLGHKLGLLQTAPAQLDLRVGTSFSEDLVQDADRACGPAGASSIAQTHEYRHLRFAARIAVLV